MTDEQFEELKEVVRTANLHPIQRACCFLCDFCDTYKDHPIRNHCRFHGYDLYDAHDSVCFQYRPLRKE